MRRASSLGFAFGMVACFSDAPPLSDDTGTTGTTNEDTSTAGGESTSPTAASDDSANPTGDVSDDGSASSDDDDTGPAACTEGECTSIPEGWEGPFAVAFVDNGEEEPDCASPFGSEYPVPMHVGLPFFDCGCQCVTSGAPPPPCTAQLRKYEGTTACEDEPSSMAASVPEDDCTQVASDLVLSVAYEAVSEPEQVPTCMLGVTVPPDDQSYWERDALLCALDGSTSCDAGVCVPQTASPFVHTCILGSGEVACPQGFGQEYDLFTDADDNRECESCGCDAEVGDCTPVIHRSMDGTCTDLDLGVADCVDVSDGALATSWHPLLAPGCYPEQVTSGTVTGQGPHTLCCRE